MNVRNRVLIALLYFFIVVTTIFHYFEQYNIIKISLYLEGIAMAFTFWQQINFNRKKKFLREEIKEENKTERKKKILTMVNLFLAVFLLVRVIEILYRTILPDIGNSVNQQGVEKGITNQPLFLFFINICVVAPIAEESIYRFLPAKFVTNKWVYIIFSSFVFAFVHCVSSPNPFIYMMDYLPTAFYLAWVYAKSKNIFLNMAIHSVINLIPAILIVMRQ